MTGSTGPRGPYAGTARRREAILEVAYEVFATQGFRGGSLREISARLGYSQSGVIHHFGSKENLLVEVLAYRESLNSSHESAAHGLALLDHLRTVVERNSKTLGAVQLFVIMSAEAAVDDEHPARQFFVDRYTGTHELFRTAFTLAKLDGHLTDDVDPDAESRQLIAFLDGIQVQWLLTPTFDMTEAYDKYVHDFLVLHQLQIPAVADTTT